MCYLKHTQEAVIRFRCHWLPNPMQISHMASIHRELCRHRNIYKRNPLPTTPIVLVDYHQPDWHVIRGLNYRSVHIQKLVIRAVYQGVLDFNHRKESFGYGEYDVCLTITNPRLILKLKPLPVNAPERLQELGELPLVSKSGCFRTARPRNRYKGRLINRPSPQQSVHWFNVRVLTHSSILGT